MTATLCDSTSAQVWDNCWEGQEVVTKELVIGVAVDQGYWEAAGSNTKEITANIQQMFNDANQIYGILQKLS